MDKHHQRRSEGKRDGTHWTVTSLQAFEEVHAVGGVSPVKVERIFEVFWPVWERMVLRMFNEADASVEALQEFGGLSPRGKEDCVADLGGCCLDRRVRWFVATLCSCTSRMNEQARLRTAIGGVVPVEGSPSH